MNTPLLLMPPTDRIFEPHDFRNIREVMGIDVISNVEEHMRSICLDFFQNNPRLTPYLPFNDSISLWDVEHACRHAVELCRIRMNAMNTWCTYRMVKVARYTMDGVRWEHERMQVWQWSPYPGITNDLASPRHHIPEMEDDVDEDEDEDLRNARNAGWYKIEFTAVRQVTQRVKCRLTVRIDNVRGTTPPIDDLIERANDAIEAGESSCSNWRTSLVDATWQSEGSLESVRVENDCGDTMYEDDDFPQLTDEAARQLVGQYMSTHPPTI